MSLLFYTSGFIALAATAMAVSRANAVHALLYLIVSFLASAGVMLALGAAFAAALEVMVYAGAIVVLFLFVVMLINVGPDSVQQERGWLRPRLWLGPGLLAGVLLLQLLGSFQAVNQHLNSMQAVSVKEVGIAFFGPYLLAVELGSFLLLAGLIAAFHLGRREP